MRYADRMSRVRPFRLSFSGVSDEQLVSGITAMGKLLHARLGADEPPAVRTF